MSRFNIPLRLVIAILVGLLAARFLDWFSTSTDIMSAVKTGLHLVNMDLDDLELWILLIPPIFLGIIASLANMSWINEKNLLLAVLTGGLTTAAGFLYCIPVMIREDAACTDPSTWCGGNIYLLVFGWIICSGIVLISTLV